MKRLKKMIALCLAFFMMLTVVPEQVQAASSSYELLYNGALTIIKGEETNWSYGWMLLGSNNKAKITKAVVTNKKLADVEIYTDKKGITIHPKKTGSTTVKVTVKNGSKKKVHTLKLQIKKYENPLSTFKVGSTSYKNKLNKRKNWYADKPKKNQKVKLNIKAKKGFEITNISYGYYKNGQYKSQTLRNGQKFTLHKQASWISVSYRDKKTGYSASVHISYN